MKKFPTRVLAVRNGSMYAVVGSGNSDMSDSWIAWKPRMEEPSKFSPSSKTAWSNDETGTVKCCMTPGRSQKRTSTISTPSSLTYLSSSSLFWNIHPPWLRTQSRDLCGQPESLRVRTSGAALLRRLFARYAGAVSRPYRDCFGHVTGARDVAAEPALRGWLRGDRDLGPPD